MSTSFQPTTLVGAIAIAMGFTTTVSANTETKASAQSSTLDTIVITAARSEENFENVPASIFVIPEKVIAENPIRNLSDILQLDPSVYIKQSGGIGQTSEISLRGTSPSQTLLLKDGARLNSQNHYAPFYSTFLDLTDVQQIEVLNGPASVQYGSDAVGGVVQLLSKTPTKSGAEITGIWGENKTYKTIVKADLITSEGFYAQLSGQRLETDGTRIFDTQKNSQKANYDQKGYNVKVGYNDQQLKTSLSVDQNKGTSLFYNWKSDENNNERKFDNQLINAKLEYKLNDAFIVSARHSNFKDQQHLRGSETGFYNTRNNETDANLKWIYTPNQNILIGTTFVESKFNSESIKDQKQRIHSTGYYIQHQYDSEHLHTQAGLRIEDNQRFGTHTVGQIAIRYQISPFTSVFTNIGSAFKAPSLSELYYFYEDGMYDTYGNPNLKPEKSTSYEIGVNQKISQNLFSSISIYQTDIKNLITPDYLPSYTTYMNADKAVIKGIDAQLKWKYEDIFIQTAYAYTSSKNKNTDTYIAYRPKQTLTLSTGLENDIYGISASLIARTDIYTNNTNSQKVPGYATIDLNAYWNINPNVKVFTDIQNVGDVEYKIADNFGNGWYINGGRLASVGVTLKY